MYRIVMYTLAELELKKSGILGNSHSECLECLECLESELLQCIAIIDAFKEYVRVSLKL
jgi:hypothetical protein